MKKLLATVWGPPPRPGLTTHPSAASVPVSFAWLRFDDGLKLHRTSELQQFQDSISFFSTVQCSNAIARLASCSR